MQTPVIIQQMGKSPPGKDENAKKSPLFGKRKNPQTSELKACRESARYHSEQ